MEMDAYTGELFIDFICDLVTFKSLPFAGQSNIHRSTNMDINLLVGSTFKLAIGGR
jgi:hypothetical protein